MLTKVIKVVAALALLAGLFSHSAADYRNLIFVLFMISLAVLRSKTRLSIASITGPGSGSESL